MFVSDPTSPEGLAVVVEACAYMYADPIQFDELLSTLNSAMSRDPTQINENDDKIAHVLLAHANEASPHTLTAQAILGIHNARRALPSGTYYNGLALGASLENIPFDMFLQVFIFTPSEAELLSMPNPDAEALQRFDLVKIHKLLHAVRTCDPAFAYYHTDALVAELVTRFYTNFMEYYGTAALHKEEEA